MNDIKITRENYHICSIGTFKPIDAIPEGFNVDFISGISRYYVNPEKTHVVRVSDHWGKKIKYCAWFLDGFRKDYCGQFRIDNSKKMFIGIIAFSDLKIRDYQLYSRLSSI